MFAIIPVTCVLYKITGFFIANRLPSDEYIHDEIDMADIGESEIRKVLDPDNKSYNAYRYAHDNYLDIEALKKILTQIFNNILGG